MKIFVYDLFALDGGKNLTFGSTTPFSNTLVGSIFVKVLFPPLVHWCTTPSPNTLLGSILAGVLLPPLIHGWVPHT